MATEAWDHSSDKKVTEAVGAISEATAGGAKYAMERVEDLATQGKRVARDLDQQLASSTGRSTEDWLKEGTRLVKAHPWKAVAAMAVVAFVLGKLRG